MVQKGRERDHLSLPFDVVPVRNRHFDPERGLLIDLADDRITAPLDHRAAGVEHALPLGRGLDRALADKFIGMYVNELTLDYGERGKKGVREFLDRAHHAGLIPAPVELEFV